MFKIKKPFEPVYDFLKENEDKQVREVLPKLKQLCGFDPSTRGGREPNFKKDAAGNTIAIRCSYYGLWMSPKKVPFAKRKHTPSGYAQMCKEGYTNMAKKQREFETAKGELLNKLAEGDINIIDVKERLEQLEIERNTKPVFSQPKHAFPTAEACIAKDVL